MKPNQETLGICRSTLVIIAVAITFGSFSVYKARGGGSLRVAGTFRVPSGTLGRTELSEVPAITNLGSATLTKADAPCPAVKTTLIPIEQILVGDRVLAESPTGEEDTAFGSEIIPSDWRKLTLRAPKRDGTVADVVLLRPLQWLNEQRSGRSRLPSGTFAGRRTNARHLSNELGSDSGTTNALSGRDASRNPARQAGPTVESQTIEDMVGGTVFISVPECGIDGNAEVLAIDPCPEIRPGSGRVVTGTFLHQARSTITLTIAGQSESIECTGNHPFWSEDRQTFVRADSLQPNETLRTATGLTTVESWTPDLNPTPVYNIEVHGAHVYHVGTSGVVVHNPGGLNILGGSCWAGAQQASEIISETRKAAQRLGFDLDRVYTEGDRAFAFIDLTKKIRHGDIEKVKDFLRGQGIKTLQIESGEFMNKVFEKQLLDRLNSGKTFLGGVVEHSDYYGSVFRIVIEI
jgi:hypothetical protein